MLAYAPRPERRRVSPTALALIIGAHAVAIVAVMSAKMAVTPHGDPPTVVTLIEETKPKPPEPQPQTPHPARGHRSKKPSALFQTSCSVKR